MTDHGPNALWELTKERDELKALLATCERVADEFRRQDDERHAAIIAERDALKAAVERARDVLPFFEGQITGLLDLHPALASTLSATYRNLVFALGQPPAKEGSSSSSGGAP